MGEQHVVVLGQEAWRCRGIRVGDDAVGDVEQLASGVVVERTQLRPQSFEHLAQAGVPRPRRRVTDRCRTERGDVAQHHGVD